MLSPVKCEELFYRDSGSRLLDSDEPPQRGATNNNAAVLYSRVSLAVHQPTVSVSMASTAGDKLSGTAAAMSMSSAGEKHQQQCVYCAQSFKSKVELERHVKATHVMPTSSQKCNICDEVFPSAAVLAEHKLTHCKVNVAVCVPSHGHHNVVAFRLSRRRRDMYCGHARLCVCPRPHAHTVARTRM